nr:histidinol dehydrogenase [Paenibacillus bovis]
MNIFEFPRDKNELYKMLAFHKQLLDRNIFQSIFEIFDEVSNFGDTAVVQNTEKFDEIKIDNIKLSEEYVKHCTENLSPSLSSAIKRAINNITEVNQVLVPRSWKKQIRPGTIIGEKVTPLESVGLWVPARKGPLISTALMLVVAAKTAGVQKIVVGMPPNKDGLGDPGTVAAAKLAGADEFVIGNGVSVIAGFSVGTPSIPEVNGIFGPGPGGIAAAMNVAISYGKKSIIGIGPTESAIIADESGNPQKIAHDLINEAEHGPDSSAILVTTSLELAKDVEKHIKYIINNVNNTKREILEHVFSNQGMGAIIIAPKIESACEIINDFAPEHLMLICRPENEKLVLDQITNAGEILIGENTPFSAANYGIGITAVLPTNSFAKAYSGITSKEMVKYSTIGELNREALEDILPIIREFGKYEMLPNHVDAANIRFKS